MMIRRMRIKNIKSFGMGPDGSGVTVEFDRGVNRVGGRNGSGKSTIIEAMGFCLFDAEPVRGDSRMRVDSYLVRNGAKTGEIDVWVEASDCVYRVERDVGQTKRRWKVVREGEEYIEAEGDDEVRSFLAGLWGLGDSSRLSEIFHGLVGVKQGHFTRPFDSAPKAARDHFDPLLDVDIFRQCFDYLLEPAQKLKDQKRDLDVSVSGLSGQIEQLYDAPARLAESEARLVSASVGASRAAAELESARTVVEARDRALNARNDSERKLAAAKNDWQNAGTRRSAASIAVEESRAACEVLAQTETAYRDYCAAEQEYRACEEQRAVRDSLKQREGVMTADLARLAQEQSGVEESLARGRDLAAAKSEEASRRRRQLDARREMLAELEIRAQTSLCESERCAGWVNAVEGWGRALARACVQFEGDCGTLLTLVEETRGRDAHALQRSVARLDSARLEFGRIQAQLRAAEEKRATLAAQIESLSGGVCPFLGEPCAQFDSGRVESQIGEMDVTIRALQEAQNVAAQAEAEAVAVWNLEQERDRIFARRKGTMDTLAAGLAQILAAADDTTGREAAALLYARWPSETALPGLPDPPSDDPEGWSNVRSALRTLAVGLRSSLVVWRTGAEQLTTEGQQAVGQRDRESGSVETEERSIGLLIAEAGQLSGSAVELEQRLAAIREKRAGAEKALDGLRTELSASGGLEQRMNEVRSRLDGLREAHSRYVQHQQTAEKLPERAAALEAATGEEKLQHGAYLEAEHAFLEHQRLYDAGLHEQAREALQQAYLAHGKAQSDEARAKDDTEEQRARAGQLAALVTQREEALGEQDRVVARLAVLEKARQVLKNAQAAVAAGLTRHIQHRAQAIFNSMSPEPSQFEWDPADYRLTLHTATGLRRFAQLSGGQQMKAAIAMQLALVKEFSSAGLCAFDEPTYGLDAESRQMLADAIQKAQQECRFEQLLIVSHDEAFDDRVEHVVNLAYSPLTGTTNG